MSDRVATHELSLYSVTFLFKSCHC